MITWTIHLVIDTSPLPLNEYGVWCIAFPPKLNFQNLSVRVTIYFYEYNDKKKLGRGLKSKTWAWVHTSYKTGDKGVGYLICCKISQIHGHVLQGGYDNSYYWDLANNWMQLHLLVGIYFSYWSLYVIKVVQAAP